MAYPDVLVWSLRSRCGARAALRRSVPLDRSVSPELCGSWFDGIANGRECSFDKEGLGGEVKKTETEVMQFINYLEVKRKVAASTQSQALNAIAFLYRDVLVIPLGEISGLNRVQQHKRIRDESVSSHFSEAFTRPKRIWHQRSSY